MNLDDKVIARFEELIERGAQILKTKTPPPSNTIGFDSTVDSQSGNQWLANALNLLSKALGKDSEHYQLFTAMFKGGVTFSPLKRGLGVLAAAKEDYQHGHLVNIRDLIAAEIFTDLLQQADELLDAGYTGPAAVLAGAVLEDELRKLCSGRSIKLPDKPKLDFMNSQLAKSGAYNKLTHKRLTAIADIRNSAAHGKWDEFTQDDVSDMIRWITSFLEQCSG